MTGVVRLLRAWIVRQDSAAENVSQMFDAQPASNRRADAEGRPAARVIDPAAYDDPPPALYLYRLQRGHESHVGVVAEVSVEAFVDGQVRGHEAVQPARVKGLVDHFASAAVRSELVALLHRVGPEADAAIAASLLHDPLVQFTGPDEWEQTVWRVPDAASAVLTGQLSGGIHYIADGHHRVAASLSEWERAGRPADAGLMCVIYPLDGLRLLAFHRRVAGPIDADKLFTLVSGAFEVRDISSLGEVAGAFGVYVDGRWWDASYLGTPGHGAAGLDITILNEQVLDPLLGDGGQASPRLEITSALSPLDELLKACDEDGGALFAMRAPALEQLLEVADRGEVMPPKTTYFDPKPYAGIFLR